MSVKKVKEMRNIALKTVNKNAREIELNAIKNYMNYVNAMSFKNRFKLCYSILFKRGKK